MDENRLPICAVVAASVQTIVAFFWLLVWGAWAGWGSFPNGLIMSSIIFGPFLVISSISAYGLWKGRMFGWITGILIDAILCLILFFKSKSLCFVLLILIVFLLSKYVRDFYVRDYYE
jgi:hypothetical protein